MKVTSDEIRTDWSARWRSYVGTVALLAVLALALAGVAALWLRGLGPGRASRVPVGFSAEWNCQGASQKGGGFCWRGPQPPPKGAPIAQDHTP